MNVYPWRDLIWKEKRPGGIVLCAAGAALPQSLPRSFSPPWRGADGPISAFGVPVPQTWLWLCGSPPATQSISQHLPISLETSCVTRGVPGGQRWEGAEPSWGSCAGLGPAGHPMACPSLTPSHCRAWFGSEQENMAQPCWFRTKGVFLRFALRLSGIFIVCLIRTVSTESSHP